VSDPHEPYDNPPNWTDPYADLVDLTGEEPLPPLEDPGVPPAQPPGSPLLTGLIIGLLLVALSVAVFQLLRPSGEEVAAVPSSGASSTAASSSTAPAAGGPSTTSATPSSTVPETTLAASPYTPVDPPIPVSKLKLMTNGIRVKDKDIKDLTFGTSAAEAVGRLTASFGNPTSDTNWEVSTGRWGVCQGDMERVIQFGPFYVIVTQRGGQDVFDGYRQDISTGNFDSPATQLETLSGLKAGDTVKALEQIYAKQKVTYSTDPLLGDIFELRSTSTAELLLWGPVQGQDPADIVLGIFAPDVCDR